MTGSTQRGQPIRRRVVLPRQIGPSHIKPDMRESEEMLVTTSDIGD